MDFMMKNKIKKKMKRQELADYLEHMAAALRTGKFETGDHSWLIPEVLQAKISHKEKKGRIDCKVKWRWSTLEQYEPAARQEVVAWQKSWKALKKQLSQSFKALEKAAGDGNIPDVNALERFIAESREMVKYAEPEWQTAMDEYIDHLGTLKQAVEENQVEAVQHEIRDLRNRMNQCHRDFK
jgi:XXXCH domain-containing protein